MPDRQRPAWSTLRDQRAKRPNRAAACGRNCRHDEEDLPLERIRARTQHCDDNYDAAVVGGGWSVCLKMEKMLEKELVCTINWTTAPLPPEPEEASARREEAEVVHVLNFAAMPP
ncbi:hypothetical protein PF001_g9853 [Phytophthora fragariae]|uniref:Uncharacterized protein n=1 Tax=Phytophthora fragariae TaxID=53985 RepID=A0A6A4E212_9STRA|nr:hypothetical protein PF006_g9740 [Phytophthora fragariae]KAE9311187.1 hypothetical protein PF001_g9853 [Phytophthora fragariae]